MMCARCERHESRKRRILALLKTGLVTSNQIAGKLKVSTRTVYRDIESLRREGEPIIGEAGMGYVLKQRETRRVSR